MKASRLHGYNQRLVLEDVPVSDIGPTEVLVKVGAAEMWLSFSNGKILSVKEWIKATVPPSSV